MKNGSFLTSKEEKKQAYYNAQVFRREDFSLHGGQGIDIKLLLFVNQTRGLLIKYSKIELKVKTNKYNYGTEKILESFSRKNLEMAGSSSVTSCRASASAVKLWSTCS